MTPYYQDASVTLYHGDMREIVPQLSGLTAVVTDPPYGLEFMGAEWDHGVPGEVFWRQILTACLPGAPLLAFGGTRTFHRLVCAIEDAGWEIRDTLMWVYSAGYPKSTSVSKQLDKAQGLEREIVATVKKTPSASSTNMHEGWRRPWAEGHPKTMDITAPASPLARLWEGYGSALAPAYEPITLARKPLDGTLAQNVMQHGVGGLNIDGTRIATADDTTTRHNSSSSSYHTRLIGHRQPRQEPYVTGSTQGRWPKNFLISDSPEVRALFPETTVGEFSGHRNLPKTKNAFGTFALQDEKSHPGSSGSAARFFQTCAYTDAEREQLARLHYAGKASPAERGRFNDHPTVKPLALMTYLLKLVRQPERNLILDPFCGSGSTLVAAKELRLPCIGIDQNEHALDIAIRRLRQEVLPFVT
jgi:site-specific DNA-methyltransferase (adenine-specific)